MRNHLILSASYCQRRIYDALPYGKYARLGDLPEELSAALFPSAAEFTSSPRCMIGPEAAGCTLELPIPGLAGRSMAFLFSRPDCTLQTGANTACDCQLSSHPLTPATRHGKSTVDKGCEELLLNVSQDITIRQNFMVFMTSMAVHKG